MKLRIIFAILALAIFEQHLFAREWRGILPLKSTRADVERLLGKPNELGRYEVNGETAAIIYSDGPCQGLYRSLEKDNCKCLVVKDAVLSIYVEPEQALKFSSLGIDKSKFSRTPIVAGPGLFSYSNLSDGVVYTVDEAEDDVTNIEYLPSFTDCQRVIATKTQIPRNSWRGLVPLHSNRHALEEVFGKARSSVGSVGVYNTENERITVKYSNGSCSDANVEWRVPTDTVLELTVTPLLGFMLRNLDLDLNLYERQKLGGLPEIPRSPEFVNYINRRDGVTIRSKQIDGDAEEVISITYGPSSHDNVLRCRMP
jgi:hypothetical protein